MFWIKRKNLNKYKLADGFKEMVEIFENDDLSEDYYFYDDEWKQINI